MQTPVTVAAATYGGDAIAVLRAEMYPRRLMRLTINGARGSRAEIYLGAITPSARVDQTARGSSNTAEYANPIDIPAGMECSVIWPGKAADYTACNATFTTERG